MSRNMLFTNDGRYLTDIRVNSTRSWILNGIGQAEFTIAVTDPKCRRLYLDFGNLLLIQHEKLPDWIGVIDVPMVFQSGKVTVRAYEITKIMQWRRTPENTTFKGSAGRIASQLFACANEQGDTRMRLEIVSGGGSTRQELLGDSVWVHLDRIRQRANNDMVITPGYAGTRLIANVEWVARAGRGEKPLVSLVEGKNLENGNVTLTVDGDFYNDQLGVSDGATDDAKLFSNEDDPASISQYGLRQGKISFSNIQDQGSLDASVRKEIRINSVPRKIVSLVALDVGDTFKYLRLGTVFNTRLTTAGFTGDAIGYKTQTRVFGMRFTDGSGRCEILNQDSADGSF